MHQLVWMNLIYDNYDKREAIFINEATCIPVFHSVCKDAFKIHFETVMTRRRARHSTARHRITYGNASGVNESLGLTTFCKTWIQFHANPVIGWARRPITCNFPPPRLPPRSIHHTQIQKKTTSSNRQKICTKISWFLRYDPRRYFKIMFDFENMFLITVSWLTLQLLRKTD